MGTVPKLRHTRPRSVPPSNSGRLRGVALGTVAGMIRTVNSCEGRFAGMENTISLVPQWTVRGMAVLLLCLCLSVLPACSQSSTRVEYIPLPALPPDDAIVLTADLAFDGQLNAHCLSYINLGRQSSGRGSHIYYHYGARAGGSWQWAAPIRIGAEHARGARIILAGERLHAITGLMLQQYVSEDKGKTWRDGGTLVHPDSAAPRTFDVVTMGDTLLIAYASAFSMPVGGSADTQVGTRLHIIRDDPHGRVDRVIAEYPLPGAAAPGPRLAVASGVVHLLMGLREDLGTWSRAAGVTGRQSQGSFLQLQHASSHNGGRTWTQFEPVPTVNERTMGRLGTVGDIGFGQPDLSLAADHEGLMALWGLSGLHSQQRRPPGGKWSTPLLVDSSLLLEPDWAIGTRTVQGIRVPGRDVAVWTTLKHTKRGRRSNDVYVGTRKASESGNWHLRRITPERTHTSSLRALAVNGNVYVLRAGSAMAGRSLAAYNNATDLSITIVPLGADAVPR